MTVATRKTSGALCGSHDASCVRTIAPAKSSGWFELGWASGRVVGVSALTVRAHSGVVRAARSSIWWFLGVSRWWKVVGSEECEWRGRESEGVGWRKKERRRERKRKRKTKEKEKEKKKKDGT